MIEQWDDVQIVPEFCDQGVDCYRLTGGSFLNEYYIVSEAETRKLMNHPEVVGYEVYASLLTATSQMMYYLKEHKKITSANILSLGIILGETGLMDVECLRKAIWKRFAGKPAVAEKNEAILSRGLEMAAQAR